MNISIRFNITLLLIILFPLAKAYAKGRPCNLDTAAAINTIRAQYQKINTSPLTKETFNYDAEGCVDGGVVTYFFNPQKEIVKIVESGSIGDGSWSREFYFQSGKFFFCYEMIIGGPAVGPVTRTEFRTYIKDDRILRYMEDKTITPPGENSTQALAASYKLIKAHTTKKFAEALCNN